MLDTSGALEPSQPRRRNRRRRAFLRAFHSCILWAVDYAHFHKNRTNLLIHIVMVPIFLLGVVYAIVAGVQDRWLAASLSLLLPVISIAVQGAGHKREPNPPLPFDGPGDFIKRIFSEQFYRFPKFVLSGQWFRALGSSSR